MKNETTVGGVADTVQALNLSSVSNEGDLISSQRPICVFFECMCTGFICMCVGTCLSMHRGYRKVSGSLSRSFEAGSLAKPGAYVFW